MSSRPTHVSAFTLISLAVTLLTTGCAQAQVRTLQVARVGWIPADSQPEFTPCGAWDPGVGVAWDYGNRSLVVELAKAGWVTGVVIVADQKSSNETKLTAETVSVLYSFDNKTYTRYEKPFEFSVSPSDKPGEALRAEFSNLGFYARYIKLKQTYNGAAYGFGITSLPDSATVLTDGSEIGNVSLDGLFAEPVQPLNQATVHTLVSGAKAEGLELELELKNAQTWETVSIRSKVEPGRWAPNILDASALPEGGAWLTARLYFGEQFIRDASTCLNLYDPAKGQIERVKLADGNLAGKAFGQALLALSPGDAEGVTAFTYHTPLAPGEQRTGIALTKGASTVVQPEALGQVACYVAVENPWPAIDIKWGEYKATIPVVQEDWQPTQNLQELFAGIGDFSKDALTVTASGGPVRIAYVRIQKLSANESALANHVPDPTNNRRVIYNNDGFTELWGVKDWDKARLVRLVERYQGTDTEFMEMAAWVSGAVSFKSKYATFWSNDDPMIQGQWLRDNDRMAVELFNQLEDDGIPIYPTLVERGREIGIPVWGSLRMSGYYGIREHQKVQPFNGKLWHEHPEMRIRRKDGGYDTQMSYAWPQVQAERIGVLGEMAELGCDGVMMDFCRYPFILGYDEPLVEGFKEKYGADPRELSDDDDRWIGYRCEFLNEFFRKVRQRVNEVAQAQGRQIRVSVRVPAAGYKAFGFDPQTWADEKLMDIFIPHYHGLERDFDVEPWAAMVKGTGILLYPGMTPTKTMTSTTELTDAQVKAGVQPGRVTTMTEDDYRRKAWQRYRQGADGVFLFNTWTIGNTRNLLGDKEALRKWSYFQDPMNLPRATVVFED